jgi:hypothetical protein
MNKDHNVLNLILMADEAHFYVMGFGNIENIHYCAPVKLEKCMTNHCIQKVSICCAVGTFGIVGPFFFDNDNGERIKADSHIRCCSHAVPLPRRSTKGLDCVFPT